ncbi:MAG: 6-bladed beta-propeller [Bacteroidota bacterium]|nr:6-bladed beta-propeller [Bacteroidota bacterium]
MPKAFQILAVFLLLCACTSKTNPAISESEEDGYTFRQISYEQISDSLDLKLSDLATDWKFIPLETLEDCMIKRAEYYVYERFIIANLPFDKILLFDGQGKYIQKITQYGKGPQEIARATLSVDEVNDILYVADEHKSYLMSWDLNTGTYLGDIPRPYKGRINRVIATDNKTLWLAPVVGYFESGDYYAWEQDLQGNIIQEIKAPHYNTYKDMGSGLLYPRDNGYNYLPVRSDTIFSISENILVPSWYVNLGEDNKKLYQKVGHRSFNYFFESNRFFCGKISTITWIEVTDLGNGGSSSRYTAKRELLVVEKRTHKTTLNQTIKNDFLGTQIANHQIHALTNQHLLVIEDAINFLEKAEFTLADPNIDNKIKSKINGIISQLDEEDNPVLLIGKI